ncbi:hypothetical protein PF010_g28077 [Phytophthora fragariae]|uniref:Uncharacterized protein n=1 Tax=Phytophthora fragariae TaxID=53985 RepID=A0A6A3HG18_9STRA|nr:hypothetical protein PF003_g8409 [Phytophthora fragariae]KAE8967538.1 hypothetical protein PF011_g27518 [Phytophthora fragariae]KAE9065745.1 hypothetical protein PF010_g28077 [Phytophthora fragariae]KAE9249741.1 hypothetical protein PF004_g3247 [Phytophthora fragariae]
MLQSFFEDKLNYLNPVVPGLFAAAVAIAFYYTTGTTEPPTVEGEHGKVVAKRVRYLPFKIPVLAAEQRGAHARLGRRPDRPL